MMSKLIDLTEQRFGMLTVKEFAGLNKHKQAKWKCLCDCGNTKVIASNNLRRGLIVSCGCYKDENSKHIHVTHGHSKTRLYKIWQGIKRRCYNSNEIRYKNYGGKGIKMFEEWKNDFSIFEEWALNNGYEDDLTIDRIDLSKDYDPSNCRWATIEQQANNKSNNVFVEVNGITHTLGEWAKIVGVPYRTIYNRYSRGERGEKLIRKVNRNKKKGI